MRMQDLPPRYQQQVVRKLAQSGACAKPCERQKGTPLTCGANPTGTAVAAVAGSDSFGKGKKTAHRLPVGDDSPVVSDFDIRYAETEDGVRYTAWMKFVFSVDPSIIPTAQQKGIDPRGERVRVFTKPHIRAWKKAFENAIAAVKRTHSGVSMGKTEDGVEMLWLFRFPYPESEPIKNRRENAPMVKRPDCDNLAKMLVDTFSTTGVLPDDNCISRLVIEKCYTLKSPSVLVTLSKDPNRNS